jgi:hypothetical protein
MVDIEIASNDFHLFDTFFLPGSPHRLIPWSRIVGEWQQNTDPPQPETGIPVMKSRSRMPELCRRWLPKSRLQQGFMLGGMA